MGGVVPFNSILGIMGVLGVLGVLGEGLASTKCTYKIYVDMPSALRAGLSALSPNEKAASVPMFGGTSGRWITKCGSDRDSERYLGTYLGA